MIFIECEADYVLVKSITSIPEIEIFHAGGKPIVCKNLERKRSCKGLVDEDPKSRQPSYMKNLRLESDLSEHDLKKLRDNPNDNNMIVLCPRLEEWILKASKEAGVDVREYNLPDNSNKLHDIINANLNSFKRLIRELKDKNPERLKNLKRLLEG